MKDVSKKAVKIQWFIYPDCPRAQSEYISLPCKSGTGYGSVSEAQRQKWRCLFLKQSIFGFWEQGRGMGCIHYLHYITQESIWEWSAFGKCPLMCGVSGNRAIQITDVIVHCSCSEPRRLQGWWSRCLRGVPTALLWSAATQHRNKHVAGPFCSSSTRGRPQSTTKSTDISFHLTACAHALAEHSGVVYICIGGKNKIHSIICINDVCRRDSSTLPEIDFFLYEAGRSYTDLWISEYLDPSFLSSIGTYWVVSACFMSMYSPVFSNDNIT